MMARRVFATVPVLLLGFASLAQAGNVYVSEPQGGEPSSAGDWTLTFQGFNSGYPSSVSPITQIPGFTDWENIQFTYRTDAPALGTKSSVTFLFEDSSFAVVSDTLVLTYTAGSNLVSVKVYDGMGPITIPPGSGPVEPPFAYVTMDYFLKNGGSGSNPYGQAFPISDTIFLRSDGSDAIPELDAGVALSALGCFGFGLAMIRSRRRR